MVHHWCDLQVVAGLVPAQCWMRVKILLFWYCKLSRWTVEGRLAFAPWNTENHFINCKTGTFLEDFLITFVTNPEVWRLRVPMCYYNGFFFSAGRESFSKSFQNPRLPSFWPLSWSQFSALVAKTMASRLEKQGIANNLSPQSTNTDYNADKDQKEVANVDKDPFVWLPWMHSFLTRDARCDNHDGDGKNNAAIHSYRMKTTKTCMKSVRLALLSSEMTSKSLCCPGRHNSNPLI